jgi:hypothetical protein
LKPSKERRLHAGELKMGTRNTPMHKIHRISHRFERELKGWKEVVLHYTTEEKRGEKTVEELTRCRMKGLSLS